MNRGRQKKYSLWLVAVCSIFFSAEFAIGAARWTVGNAEHPWSSAGSFEGLDDTAEEGWLQPVFVSEQNLSLTSIDRGGWVVIKQNIVYVF